MNFRFLTNIFLFSVLAFMNSACGVKSNPLPPEGTNIPSYLNQFLTLDKKSIEALDLEKDPELKKKEEKP